MNTRKRPWQRLEQAFRQKDVCLLHGVTSSGKTEVYTRFIQKHLENHQQVLYLVPEIALTTQLITRLNRYFGEKVLVFHSRFSDRERDTNMDETGRKPAQSLPDSGRA
ncbi:MAG: DEAD/DEAH box helicase family protein [Owenweeksia sp.]|nr:DEAD/DEAH box helicase family protein [Owenweeksia sp.]